MQGVQGGADRPKPDASGLETESAKQMKQAGFDRAKAEDWQKKGVVEKVQEKTASIKDVAADKMDKLGATVKSTFISEK